MLASCVPEPPLMPEIVAEPPSSSCYRLFPTSGTQESQGLDPDRFLPRARVREGVLQREARETRAAEGRHPQSQGAHAFPGCDPGIATRAAERAGLGGFGARRFDAPRSPRAPSRMPRRARAAGKVGERSLY